MNNQDFNDAIIALAAHRMTEQGYAQSEKAALEWLNLRSDHGAEPAFSPEDSSFAARGAAKTLARLCTHAWNVLRWRRSGEEIELPAKVKAYYTPIFEKVEA